MKDTVILGTGNSRYLKSAISAGTSWESALAMLIAGTFPIDFNGINDAGISQLGTALTKANLLKDATAALFGLEQEAVPDDALVALKALVDDCNANADSRAKIATGYYVGNHPGTSYVTSTSQSVNVGFKPRIVLVAEWVTGTSNFSMVAWDRDHYSSTYDYDISGNRSVKDITITDNGFSVTATSYRSNYAGNINSCGPNMSGKTYYYIAIN